MENKCKNCQHFERSMLWNWPEPKKPAKVGKCSELENDFAYYETDDDADTAIADSKIVCSNLYVHETFGCIHFKPKDNEQR